MYDSIQPINRPLTDSSFTTPIVTSLSSKPAVKITPTHTPVNPGLSLPQDFPPLVAPQPPPPAPPRPQRKVTTSAAIKPVIPVLPNPSSKPTSMQKDPQQSEQAGSTEPGIHSVPEASVKSKPKEDAASLGMPEAKTAPKPSKTSPANSSKPADKKSRPSKLDIAAAKDATKKNKNATDIAGAVSGPGPSQPPTPATAVSQASASSATRPNQFRPTRVPPLPKAETRPASPAMAPTITSKQPSRRPSITSIDRPGTPASEKFWDNMSFASTTLSRANSPPPSKVGSAPVRQVTKSQQKKERQARAKQAEEASKVEEIPAKVEEPMQAPIIGRKKKAKKEKTQGSADSTPTVTRPTSPVPKEEEAVEEKAEPVTPIREGKKTASKIAADMKEPDTPSSPATPASNDPQKASLTAASIFASLLKSGELSSTVSELFKSVPGLNYRFEGLELDLAVADDSMVSDSQMHSLDQGEAITIQKSPTNHVVVLPDRSALRGLTAAQAARYLELRKQALANGDVPSNQALAGLVPVLPQVSLPVARFTSRASSEDQKLPNHFAAPAPGPTPLSAQMQKYGAMEGSRDESFLKRIPSVSVERAEQDLSLSRKETEVVEKKLNALLKKNRRLLFGSAH
ncbi:hypothetical protein HO133_007660 [Letharia lupina]|uniref:Uncharacterized protein n=1 Tax=Letharia lupina TaxID=560253 RepID=A0A8H6FGR2_9LECA|nr:uncharacterized protein HO133_007660 [Letharia lupina]KAF6227932.1 hypothetical protein HO133_007660 [Letharia lupina]